MPSMKNSMTRSKLFLPNFQASLVGFFVLSLALLFFFKDKLIIGSILLLISTLLITHKQMLSIDEEEFTVTVRRKILFVSYTSRTILLNPKNGKIILVNSMNEVNGLDRKSNTFYNYDVLYQLNDGNTINIYASTNEAQADKIAVFISNCLNMELEYETNDRRL
jgi:hypothetical protein